MCADGFHGIEYVLSDFTDAKRDRSVAIPRAPLRTTTVARAVPLSSNSLKRSGERFPRVAVPASARAVGFARSGAVVGNAAVVVGVGAGGAAGVVTVGLGAAPPELAGGADAAAGGVLAGAGGAIATGGAAGTTIGVAADVASVLRTPSVAVTRTRMREPESAAPTV